MSWQPPPGRGLTERVGPPRGEHSPLTYLFPALPQGTFGGQGGRELGEKGNWGAEVWTKALEELRASQEPHLSSQDPLKPLPPCVLPSEQTDWQAVRGGLLS